VSPSAATRILSEEHRLIERGLDCLAAIARAARRERRLDAKTAAEALALIRDFADRCHHAKEEDRLFAAMEAAGLERDGGVLGVMLEEHESGRGHVRAMAAVVDRAAGGDADAIAVFGRHADELDELLREHIEKEDSVLFPLGDEMLGHAGGEALLADFRRLESEAGARRHAEWVRRLDDLCRPCGVEPIARSALPAVAKEFL
jgi:hemerythrin-like domain-containing protein